MLVSFSASNPKFAVARTVIGRMQVRRATWMLGAPVDDGVSASIYYLPSCCQAVLAAAPLSSFYGVLPMEKISRVGLLTPLLLGMIGECSMQDNLQVSLQEPCSSIHGYQHKGSTVTRVRRL